MASTTLEDRVVIVTGSAAGIGKVIAMEAARQGAKVVVNSRKAERLEEVVAEIERLGAEVLPVSANVRDPDQVESLVEAVKGRYGRVDVLVNNAGGRFVAAAEDITPNGWAAVIETNLTAAFLCARSVFSLMRDQGGGRIINISSVGGMAAFEGESHYAAAKAGLNNLTATLAREWAPYNIQVNCIAPGAILTDASSFADDNFREKIEDALPGKRIGSAEEIAEVVLFLAAMQGTYLTGEIIRVDGAVESALPSPPYK